nr:accessory gene regulator B family protein [Bombilactobacillus bombi]
MELYRICKCAEIYIVAILLGTVKNTLIMHSSYALLRWFAGGWHAKKSINCSIFGIITFAVFPFILQSLNLKINIWEIIPILLITLILIYYYSPSDSEKNPMVNKIIRNKAHKRSVITVIFLSILVLFLNSNTEIYIVLGIFIESFLVTPLFYKIMKVRYNNYEEYAEIN